MALSVKDRVNMLAASGEGFSAQTIAAIIGANVSDVLSVLTSPSATPADPFDVPADVTAETARAQAQEALLIPLTQKGDVGGVGTLDSNRQQPLAQVPTVVARTAARSLLAAASVSVNPRPQQAFLMSDYDTGTTYSDTDLQAAINAAGAVAISNGYAELILDSRTVYNLANAPAVGAHKQYAQLALPFSALPSNQVAQYLCIKGPAEPGALASTHLNGTGHGPIIRSVYTTVPAWDGTKGLASIIGGPSWLSFGGGQPALSGLGLSLRGVTVRSSGQPVMAAVDASGIQGFDFDGLTVDTDAFGAGSSSNASPNAMAVGLLMATEGSSAESKGGDAYVLGYRCAYMTTQQLVAARLQALNCYIGIALGPTRHANTIRNYGDWWNVVGIAGGYAPNVGTLWAWSSAMAPVVIETWDIEALTSGAQTRLWDLWLPSAFCPQALKADLIFSRGGAGAPLSPPPLLVKGQGTLNNFNGHIRDLSGATGPRTAPGVPASGTALQNTFYRDCLVTISGGTVSDISINGVSTGQTSGVIVVPSGGYITLTYTVAPAWAWQAS